MMVDSTRSVIGGVDTHKDLHVAAALDSVGGVIATCSFSNSSGGYGHLLEWLGGLGELDRVGVEGTGSYGAGLCRYLVSQGVVVVEVNRPDRVARRREGKADDLDAIAAARAVLAERHSGTAKSGDGIVESIRQLRACRRSAMRSRTQCANQLHSLVDTAPDELGDRLRGQSLSVIVEDALATEGHNDLARPDMACGWALNALAQRWVFLTNQLAALDAHLDQLVARAAPKLVAVYGIGPDTAGALLVAAGDNPERLHSEAAFAALCGVAPLPASSGRTNRHRLNRGGNREANQALWRIAMVRMASDARTRDYVERRTKEGLSKREIIRCLKRYIAREVFPILQPVCA